MLFDVFRVLRQRKSLYCYFLIGIWFLLVVAAVYKFLKPIQTNSEPVITGELFHNLALDVKTKKIFQICNSPDGISVGDEGIWKICYSFCVLD